MYCFGQEERDERLGRGKESEQQVVGMADSGCVVADSGGGVEG